MSNSSFSFSSSPDPTKVDVNGIQAGANIGLAGAGSTASPYIISGTAMPYTLPTASTTVLGGVKVDGTSVTIASGVISAASSGAAGSATTLFVAASTASAKIKAIADYVCTGTNDHTTINTALGALPSGKGTVILSAGTFSASGTINLAADQTLVGQGAEATQITGTATTFHVIHMGNRQASGVMSNFMGLEKLAVSSAGGANTYSTVWADGIGNGSYIRDVKASEGAYNFRLTDADQCSFTNIKGFNPRTASIYVEVGLENTWGNVAFYSPSMALSDTGSTCFLIDASAAQTSPNRVDRVTVYGALFYSSVGLTGTTGIKANVGIGSFEVIGSLSENPIDHVSLIGQSDMVWSASTMIQNSGLSTNGFKLATNPHKVTVISSRFQQMTNLFNGVSQYSNICMLGLSDNQGSIGSLWTGQFGARYGTDTQFAGDGVLSAGGDNEHYSQVSTQSVNLSKVGAPNTATGRGGLYYSSSDSLLHFKNELGTDISLGSGGGSSFITSITTTGTSGPATVASGVLNVPNYAGGSGGTWGSITGTLSSQTDLNTALAAKVASSYLTGATTSGAATTIGNGTTGYLKLGDGQISKTSGTGFQFGSDILGGGNNIGSSGNYWGYLYASRHYLNSTAYLDGATAGAIALTGSLGIGLSTPLTKLHVEGISTSLFRMTNSANSGRVSTQFAQDASGGIVQLYDGSENYKTQISGGGVSFFTGGNVGIGTSTPGSTLDVNGTANISGVLTVPSTSTSGGVQIGDGTTGYLKVGDSIIHKTSGNFFSFADNGIQGIRNLMLGADSPDINVTATFIQKLGTTNILAIMRGQASQTGDLLQFQNSSSTVLSKVDASGGFHTPTLQVGTSTTSGYVLTADGSGNATWQASSSTGTVSSVSVTTANGVSGTVATSTTTPAISLTLGAITPSSVASTGAVSGTTGAFSSTGSFGGNVTLSTGKVQLANSQGIQIKDSSGSYQDVFYLDGSNNYSSRNAASTGNAYYGLSNGSNNGSVVIQVAGANTATLTSSKLAIPGLQIGTSTTTGYVWTATDTSGNGSWQASSGGGLSNPMTSIGDIIQGATAGAPARLASVATGNVLISGGVTTANSWGKVGLTTHVTGTLPVTNGGTGVTTSTGTGSVVLSTSPTLVTPALGTPSALVATNATGTAASLTAGIATVANGLKSATTTVAVSSATAPTIGQVLTATGTTAATWQTPSGGGLATSGNDALAGTLTITSTGNTSATSGLKVLDSGSNYSLNVRDNGTVSVGAASDPDNWARFYVAGGGFRADDDFRFKKGSGAQYFTRFGGTGYDFKFQCQSDQITLYGAGGMEIHQALKLSGVGTPAVGKVLTSDASGNATWATPSGGGGGLAPTFSVVQAGNNAAFGQTAYYGLYTANVTKTIAGAETFLPYIQSGSTIEIGIYSASTLLLIGSGTATTTSTAGYLQVAFSASVTAGTHYYYAILNRTSESTTQFASLTGTNNAAFSFNLTSKTALDSGGTTLPTSGRNSTGTVPYIMFY